MKATPTKKKRKRYPHESDEARLVTVSPCSVCGKKIQLTMTWSGSIKGGYYFGNIPLHRKSELKKMSESGTHKTKIGSIELDVCNYDPKPYAYAEFWECDTCYKKSQSGPSKPVGLHLHKIRRPEGRVKLDRL
jgi:hypothetical protein